MLTNETFQVIKNLLFNIILLFVTFTGFEFLFKFYARIVNNNIKTMYQLNVDISDISQGKFLKTIFRIKVLISWEMLHISFYYKNRRRLLECI